MTEGASREEAAGDGEAAARPGWTSRREGASRRRTDLPGPAAVRQVHRLRELHERPGPQSRPLERSGGGAAPSTSTPTTRKASDSPAMSEDTGVLRHRLARAPRRSTVLRHGPQGRVRHAGPHLFHRLRAGSSGGALHPSDLPDHEPGASLGGVVSAAADQAVRDPALGPPGPHPHGARLARAEVRRSRGPPTTSASPATASTSTTTTSSSGSLGADLFPLSSGGAGDAEHGADLPIP